MLPAVMVALSLVGNLVDAPHRVLEDFGALDFEPAGALVTCANGGAHRKSFSNRNLDTMLPVAPLSRPTCPGSEGRVA